MKKLFLSLLLLLGISSLVSSSSEVSAAIDPSGNSIPATYVASPEVLEVIGPSSELVDHMIGQIADVDPRFDDLSQYGSLTYFMTVDSYKNENAEYMYQRDIVGGYKFYILPDFPWNSTFSTLRATIIRASQYVAYTGYNDPDIPSNYTGPYIKNAFFASDFTVGRETYVYGYTFDADGTLNQSMTRDGGNSSDYTVSSSKIAQPLATGSDVRTNQVRAFVVRGNLINMPLYYRIPSIDSDSVSGSGGNGGSDPGDGGFWENFIFLFTGIFDSLWNDISNFFSPIVDFFINIVDWFIDLFKRLFIPSEAFIENMVASWNDWFKEEFGMLYEAVDIVVDVIKMAIVDAVSGDRIINLGTLFGGEAFIDYGVIERAWPSLFAMFQLILRFSTAWALLLSTARMFIIIASDAKVLF